MGEVRFMISEAAKKVQVESHVLRYWEEELGLTIGRTEMGHRYYTKDDIQLFRCIKKLKDEGMLLKDLKPLIPDLKDTRNRLQKDLNAASANHETVVGNSEASADKPKAQKNIPPEVKETSAPAKPAASSLSVSEAEVIPITQLEQVRSLIGDVLAEVVTDNNKVLKKEITKTVTTDVMREMDFLFQSKERQEEEHFRKLDCLIRQQQASRRESVRETPIGRLKKLLT